MVFLLNAMISGADIEKFEMSSLPVETRNAIEADSFWCLSKFLDCIQDNYIFAQLGIQEKVNQLRDLIQRIDGRFPKTERINREKHDDFLIISQSNYRYFTSSFAGTWRRLSTVLISLDEQSVDT